MPARIPGDRIQTASTAGLAVPGGTRTRRHLVSEEWTVTSRPVWRTAWAGEQNRRVSPERPDDPRTERPNPIQLGGQSFAARLAAGDPVICACTGAIPASSRSSIRNLHRLL